MTTPARGSSAPCLLQHLWFRASLLAAVLAFAVPLAGCDFFKSDFDVAVGNRTGSTVSIFADGQKLGDVGSNGTATFTVEETPLGRTSVASGGSPTSPRPITQVTFSAQDIATGILSTGVAATLVKDVTTYVDVAPCERTEGGSASPCVSVVSGTVPVPGGTTPPGQTCTFTLSPASESFDVAGGTGNVNVSAPTGCTWTATSNQSFLTVVSGASGSGNGVVAFLVAPNTTAQTRTATLTIGTQTFTVTQTAEVVPAVP